MVAAQGIRPPELDEEHDIAGLDYLWAMFLELHEGRTGNGMGANPITWPDMAAWSALTGQYPQPWEVKLLRALDREWMVSQGDG